jgi:hypothetical protein
MTQCPRCGLISENDSQCGWCGRPLAPAAIAAMDAPRRTSMTIIIGVAAMVLAGTMLILLASRPMVAEAETLNQPEQRAAIQSKATLRSSPPLVIPGGIQTPHILSGAIQPATPDQPSDAEPLDEMLDRLSQPAQTSGQVGIADASVNLIFDDDGNSMAGGSVTIVNDSPYAVTDVRLSLEAAGGTHTLMAFEGSPDDALPVPNVSIAPYGQVELPVISDTMADVGYLSTKTVVLQAQLADGSVRTDRVTIP